jgi:hypothetical protein
LSIANVIADQLSTAKITLDQQRLELERLRQLAEQEALRSQRAEHLLEAAAAMKDDCSAWVEVSFDAIRTLLSVLDDPKQIEIVRCVRDSWIDEIRGEIGSWIPREVVAEFVTRVDTALKASATDT